MPQAKHVCDQDLAPHCMRREWEVNPSGRKQSGVPLRLGSSFHVGLVSFSDHEKCRGPLNKDKEFKHNGQQYA